MVGVSEKNTVVERSDLEAGESRIAAVPCKVPEVLEGLSLPKALTAESTVELERTAKLDLEPSLNPALEPTRPLTYERAKAFDKLVKRAVLPAIVLFNLVNYSTGTIPKDFSIAAAPLIVTSVVAVALLIESRRALRQAQADTFD